MALRQFFDVALWRYEGEEILAPLGLRMDSEYLDKAGLSKQ